MDREMLEKFFNTLFPEGEYFVEFRYKTQKGIKQKFIHRNILPQAINELIENEQTIKSFEMWFGVCPRKDKVGTKQAIDTVNCLWTDIDDIEQDKINELLKDFPFPNIIVNTGGGIHLYWLLEEPFKISSEQDLNYIESILKGISTALGGDKTHDITRILRIPETYNNKYSPPRKVIITSFDTSFKYKLSDFEKYKDAIEQQKQTSVVVEKRVEVNIDDYATELPFWVVDAIKNGWTPESKYKTRSEMDFAVMISLVYHNFTDEMIYSIFTDPRYKISQKALEHSATEHYLKHTLEKAKNFVEIRRQQWLEKVEKFKDFNEVIEVYKKWFYLEDTDYLKIIHASLIAHKFDAKPVWIIAIAPPSMTKTSVLQDLYVLKKYNVRMISELTSKTLVSGDPKYKGLLFEINNGVLVFKDFTTILQLDSTSRSEILQQLREVWDGKYSKSYGTGKKVEWEGKITVLAGGTEAYEVYRQIDQTLGERFLIYRPVIENRKKMVEFSLNQLGNEEKMRKELQDAIISYHASVDVEKDIISQIGLDDNIKEQICNIASLITLFRSGVKRETIRKEIEYVPQPEAPTRLAQQITILAFALAILNKNYTITEEELRLIRRIALMTVPLPKYRIIKYLVEKKETTSIREMSEALHIPKSTLARYLEEMWCFKILLKTDEDHYVLSPEILVELEVAGL